MQTTHDSPNRNDDRPERADSIVRWTTEPDHPHAFARALGLLTVVALLVALFAGSFDWLM